MKFTDSMDTRHAAELRRVYSSIDKFHWVQYELNNFYSFPFSSIGRAAQSHTDKNIPLQIFCFQIRAIKKKMLSMFNFSFSTRLWQKTDDFGHSLLWFRCLFLRISNSEKNPTSKYKRGFFVEKFDFKIWSSKFP